ncbi:MAG: hypothetical protein A3F41_03155 [Coxiella sp. RIFCSPHIGHO2_12_FULL_44_14]|nr:MAG: hypothetical protein A3F41_03155 [Coxiella sp. RIFCSPHIGHO2_12_FULL_44_14]
MGNFTKLYKTEKPAQKISIGISDIAVFTPKNKMSINDMSSFSGIEKKILLKKIGVKNKTCLLGNVNPMKMAICAATELINKNNFSPLEIDCIIFASCGVSDKQLWSPAAKIQESIGAINAFSFEICNGCNSGNLAINIARKILYLDSSKQNVLIVVCDALSRTVDHKNPNHLYVYNFSDGAAAILLKKGEKRNNLLSFFAKTNSKFVDHIYIPIPKKHVVISENKEEDKDLSRMYKKMYIKVIRGALNNAGISVDRISHLFINQGDHYLINYISRILKIPDYKIYKSCQEYGHMGNADIFFGFFERQKNGEIFPGDIIVLASSAIGFSWGATVIQA